MTRALIKKKPNKKSDPYFFTNHCNFLFITGLFLLALVASKALSAPAQAGEKSTPPPVFKHMFEKQSSDKNNPLITGAVKAPSKNDTNLLTAKFACAARLGKLGVKYEFIPAIQKGRCGNLSPVKLAAIGRQASVAIKPAATVNCHLTEKLDLWMRTVVQPGAKHYLGEPIASIQNIASYACRHRYNDPRRKLSEHAKANALDIASFTTKSGKLIDLKQHWRAGDRKAAFLRHVHKGACKIFKVVLGPEANKAHENHFHFDLGRWPVCQ